MNVLQLTKHKKNSAKKVVLVTCYDYTMARFVNESEIDGILIGDSSAMVMHGHANTITATAEMITWHTQAVAAGITQKFIISDMPFLSTRGSVSKTMRIVQQLMQAGAHMIKIEGAPGNSKIIQHIVESGVPVMGHIGLTAQFLHQLGGFKVQGKTEECAKKLLEHAQIMQDAGCNSIVLECMPSDVAKLITEKLTIPTIGIGAGPYTDGQILVLQDLLGFNKNHVPKFVKAFAQGFELCQQALNDYAREVNKGEFPSLEEHCY